MAYHTHSWYDVEHAPVPADVIVYKEGNKAVAKDSKGRIIEEDSDLYNVLSSAIENGYHIYIASGSYKMYNTVETKAGRRIEGACKQAVQIYVMGDFPALKIISPLTWAEDIIVEKLSIWANTQGKGIGLQVDAPRSVIIRDLQLLNLNYGVYVTKAWGDVIYNVRTAGCNYGIVIDDTNGGSQFRVISSQFRGSSYDGVWLTPNNILSAHFIETISERSGRYNWNLEGGHIKLIDCYSENGASTVADFNFGGATYEFIGKGSYNGKYGINRGTITITAGNTSVTVNHGLVSKPSNVLATPLGDPGDRYWIDNVTDTTFDIVLASAPTSDVTFSWYAEV